MTGVKRKALGRGLSALLPDNKTTRDELIEIDIDHIIPNSQQPRTIFDDDRLEELTQSIRSNGIMQPILVRKTDTDKYQIIAGERRWRASQRAGLLKIPAVIRETPDEKLLELALIENIQRQELNPIEEATAYKKLIDDLRLKQEEIATRVGKERSTITNMLRLLRLSEDVQRLIEDGRISMGHARALLSLQDKERQHQLAEDIIAQGLSVRETEKRVRLIIEQNNKNSGESLNNRIPTDPNIKAAEAKLEKILNTRIRILKRQQGGYIEINFYNDEDLDRLYSHLAKK